MLETPILRQAEPTRALVLHPDLRDRQAGRDPEARLAEALALAEALPGIAVVGAQIVRLSRPDPGLLFGKGRVEELKEQIAADQLALVIVDGPVSPVQQRNLEKAWNVKLLDRTALILEIFAARARTREGVLQVELAQLSYQRTRLVRAWTHLERQRGGFGFVGGPGETQLEADRRAIDAQIVRLRRQLDKVARTRALHRRARRKLPYPLVALVGYTNAGKSTLFNRLTGAAVEVRDQLFATLDPTLRQILLPGGVRAFLSDTVGFISDLPTQLVAAFRATLEEVTAADLIVHVRNIAHPEADEQARDVETVLTELGVGSDVPRIELWNKADLLSPDDPRRLIARPKVGVVLGSALTGEGIETLCQMMATALSEGVRRETITLPHAAGRARAWLYAEGVVQSERATEEGLVLTVLWSPRQRALLADFFEPSRENGS